VYTTALLHNRYKLGIWVALTAGFVSIPLIFHLDCVLWFNDAFVTFEDAGEGELDTWLEVGAFAWNWMEPPLGEASFFILCMQMTRNNMQNLGWKPYDRLLPIRRGPLYQAPLDHVPYRQPSAPLISSSDVPTPVFLLSISAPGARDTLH
jgi:hypothetical protein